MPNSDDPAELMPDPGLREYSLKLAACALDSLIDAGIVAKANFADAQLVAAVELYIRFSTGDLPPKNPGPKTDATRSPA